jgi:hypothetical protein
MAIIALIVAGFLGCIFAALSLIAGATALTAVQIYLAITAVIAAILILRGQIQPNNSPREPQDSIAAGQR